MRKALSKSLRFEIFKRDKFTCQYCGQKSPEVILHVDHIDPVSKGGNNEILNLITSCYDCNMGKGNKKLSDNAVVEKQRKQLELLQEKREQIELMFEWKKSLENLERNTATKVKRYINKKIYPYTISDTGMTKIKKLISKHGVDEVLEATDIATTKYLKYAINGELLKTSVEESIDKIGGILFNKNLNPIAQKISYIKGVANNSFNYFDPKTASILLNNYVKALRDYWDYDDEQIINDLEGEVLLKTKDARGKNR